MKITILNGNPNGMNKDFDQFLAKLSVFLEKEHHAVTNLELRSMDIKYCRGCWGCWVKTPGKCVFSDDSYTVCDETINADLVLFASPLIMGFASAVLKKTMDKLIPLAHPYIELVEKECHHRKRYDKYPLLGLVLERGGGHTDDEDIEITTDIFRRFALNFRSSLALVTFTDIPVQEVTDEINAI